LGSSYPGQMGITTWSESVDHNRVKTNISIVLIDASDPDSHMIRIWLTWTIEMFMRWRLLPHALEGLPSRALNWGCYPGLILRLLPRILLRLLPQLCHDNKNVILTLLINGWDQSLTLVIGCWNKILPTKMLNNSKPELAYLCYSHACHILSACTCWVRHGLTLAIPHTPNV
jgi:hypothetical protein